MTTRTLRLSAIVAVLLLAGCNTLDRLSQVGKAPPLRPIENPTARPDWRPVSLPMPQPEVARPAGANSLWRSGARGFFRDQRARRVGDILTIEVSIADKAQLDNETSRGRTNTDNLGLTDLFGYENKLKKIFPSTDINPLDPASLVAAKSDMLNKGVGKVDREETIDLKMAAVIVQVLPNGNLVVQGRQEVRVNYEVREIYVAGVVRPEDISPDNSVKHEQIAELRVAYGGRGQITDVQQPRWGAQVMDILLPY